MDSKEEKLDERKKIVIISEIDELKVIAHNHYLMGKYDDAIKTAKDIIELARQAELNSIVKEQQKFISKVYQLSEKGDQKSILIDDFKDLKKNFENLLNSNKIYEAHELVRNFNEKHNKVINLSLNTEIQDLINREKKIWELYSTKQKDIRRKLEPLEIQLNSYLSTNNVILANDVMKKAKGLLKEVTDESIKEKWDTLEVIFIELKKKYDFLEKIESLMREVTKLTDKYEFDQANNLLRLINQIVEEKSLGNFKKEINLKKRSILDAKQKYNKLMQDIEHLEILVEESIKKFLFNDAIDNCNQIIKIARFIGKKNYVDKYSEYINDIKKKIRDFNEFEKLRILIIKLNSEAINALNKEHFELALKRFKEIKEKLTFFINEQ
ncbi:MAG: hypothetical protein ACFFBH_04440 [Promethearchaeota archaeon]